MPEPSPLDVLRDALSLVIPPECDPGTCCTCDELRAALADVAALVEAARTLAFSPDWIMKPQLDSVRAALAPFPMPADRKEQP